MEAHEVAEWQSLLPGDCPFPLDTEHAPFAESLGCFLLHLVICRQANKSC